VNTASKTRGDSLNMQKLRTWFESHKNVDGLMRRSSLYSRAGTSAQIPADNEEDQQLSAKLHCLYGIPGTILGRRSMSTHPYARSKVYDLRNYTDKTEWGPFRDDGSLRVDWEMLESIMIVLAFNSSMCCRMNMRRFQPRWLEPFEGVVKESARSRFESLPMELDLPLEMKDPYNISGVWSRVSRDSQNLFVQKLILGIR